MHLRRTVTVALFASASLCTLLIACKKSPPEANALSDGKASLTLVSTYPPPNEVVSRETVVVADLNYSIADFAPNEYVILVQVQTATEGVTTDGSYPSELYKPLKQPNGQVRVSFPLHHVWNDSTVSHPPRVWFYLTRQDGPRTSKMISRAGPVQYAESK